MGKIIIKRKVTLEFLGDEYKDSYLTFKAIPVKDYTAMLANLPKDGEDDNGKSITMMLEMLTRYFVEGEFLGDAVSKEDMGDIDQETAIHCFETVVGKKSDPKD